jgi:protein O-mannosyl-transferase
MKTQPPAITASKNSLAANRPSKVWPGVQTLLPVTVAFTLTLIAYWPACQGVYLLDDFRVIAQNPEVQAGWPSFSWRSPSQRYLMLVTFASDVRLFGSGPWGHHLTNLILHLLAGFVLYLLASQVLRQKEVIYSDWLAAGLSAIWLCHPINTQAVTYLTQRGEVLAGLCYLLIGLAISRSAIASRNLAIGWLVVGWLALVAGATSKQIIVTAPIVWLLFDRLALEASWKGVFAKRWLFYLACVLPVGWLLQEPLAPFLASTSTAGPSPDVKAASAGFGIEAISSFEYFVEQPRIMLHYLRLAIIPIGLCFDYGLRAEGFSLQNIAAITLLLGGGCLCLWSYGLATWRKPVLEEPTVANANSTAGWLAWCGLASLACLAPSSSILPIADLAVEHRMYLAIIPIMLAAGLAAAKSLTISQTCYAAIGIGCLFALLTFQRNQQYQSAEVMWQDVTVKAPNNPRGHVWLARELSSRGEHKESLEHLTKAIELTTSMKSKPQPSLDERASWLNRLGTTYQELGQFASARAAYEQSCQIDPTVGEGWNNLGTLAFLQNDFVTAQNCFKTALERTPNAADTWYNLGNTLAQQGQLAEADAAYQKATTLAPSMGKAWYNRAAIQERMQNFPLAEELYVKATTLPAPSARLLFDLGSLLLRQGRSGESVSYLTGSLDIDPQPALTWVRRGEAFLQQGQRREAVSDFQEALRRGGPNWALKGAVEARIVQIMAAGP